MTPDFRFTRGDIDRAAEIVYRTLTPTPQFAWPLLAAELAAEVWVKHENFSPTGAFKVRGGLVYFHELTARNAPPAGVITATRGNHGQSVGFAARRSGIEVLEIIDRAVEHGPLAARPARDACVWCDFRPVCGGEEEWRTGRKPATMSDLEALRRLP